MNRRPRALSVPSRVALLHALEAATSEFEESIVLLHACGVTDCLDLPIGVVDRLLLQAHRLVTGRDLEAVATCPACAALVALPLGPDDVPAHAPRWAWCGPGAGVREPMGADLLGLPEEPQDAAEELARRCWVGPAPGPRDPQALDLAEQSLCGEVRVACTDCGAPVVEHVDVEHLVTAAVGDALASVDVEIHLIASRYGWDLPSIEALSETRRVRLASLAAQVPA